MAAGGDIDREHRAMHGAPVEPAFLWLDRDGDRDGVAAAGPVLAASLAPDVLHVGVEGAVVGALAAEVSANANEQRARFARSRWLPAMPSPRSLRSASCMSESRARLSEHSPPR